MKFIDAKTQLSRKSAGGQCSQLGLQVRLVRVPHSVGHDLVELKSKLRRPAAQPVQELRVKKRFAAGKAKDPNAISVSLFQEADGPGDIQALGPFDGYTAVRTRQVALIGSGE